jgi:hypothetical protein
MGEIPSILALEPDPDRAKALTHLVHEYVDANVVVSASADVAVSVLSRRMPQLILLSAFTPPADERSLMTFLRGVTRDNVPVLIISSIPEPSAARSPWSLRRTPDTRPAIMRDALGARMLGALDKSKEHGYEGMRCHVIGDESQALLDVPRAHRWSSRNGASLSGIRLSSGFVGQLLNISSSGLLVESDSALMPGTAVTFEFCGPTEELIRLWRPNAELAVSAHIVRSEVSKAGPACFRYRVAARFCDELELLSAEPTDESESNPVQVLEIQPAATEDIAGVARRAAEQLQELARVLKSFECAVAGRHRMGAETRSRALVEH